MTDNVDTLNLVYIKHGDRKKAIKQDTSAMVLLHLFWPQSVENFHTCKTEKLTREVKGDVSVRFSIFITCCAFIRPSVFWLWVLQHKLSTFSDMFSNHYVFQWHPMILPSFCLYLQKNNTPLHTIIPNYVMSFIYSVCAIYKDMQLSTTSNKTYIFKNTSVEIICSVFFF